MTRGIGDPAPLPEEANNNDEVTDVINELIKGQNKLHDRIIDLERRLDHMTAEQVAREPRSRSEAKRFKIMGL